jgi:hypothetical protein
MHSILDLTKQDVYSSIAIAVAIGPGPAHRPRGGVCRPSAAGVALTTHLAPTCVTVPTLIDTKFKSKTYTACTKFI